MVAKASEGVNCEGEEDDAIVVDGCKVCRVVNMAGVCQLSPGARKMGLVQSSCRRGRPGC